MKETAYILTEANYQTYGGMQWGLGVEATAPGNGESLSTAYIHAYTSPLLAVLIDPMYGSFLDPVLWRCEAIVERRLPGNLDCTWLKTIETMLLPKVTTEQRVHFGILAARTVYGGRKGSKRGLWDTWADRWLDGSEQVSTTATTAFKEANTTYDFPAAYAAIAASKIEGLDTTVGQAVGEVATTIAFYAATAAIYAAVYIAATTDRVGLVDFELLAHEAVRN